MGCKHCQFFNSDVEYSCMRLIPKNNMAFTVEISAREYCQANGIHDCPYFKPQNLKTQFLDACYHCTKAIYNDLGFTCTANCYGPHPYFIGKVCPCWEEKKDEISESKGLPQRPEENEFRYLSPEWLNELAKGLTKGAKQHPDETWHGIPAKEHAYRAVRHLVMWLAGDRSDTHIINASMRCMMAFETDKKEGK